MAGGDIHGSIFFPKLCFSFMGLVGLLTCGSRYSSMDTDRLVWYVLVFALERVLEEGGWAGSSTAEFNVPHSIFHSLLVTSESRREWSHVCPVEPSSKATCSLASRSNAARLPDVSGPSGRNILLSCPAEGSSTDRQCNA